MPSSPGPNDYQRKAQRFLTKGVALLPQDLINDSGKSAYVRNVRTYMEGTWTVRDGTVRLAEVAPPLHTLIRLNDPTPLGVGSPQTRLLGAGTSVYRQVVGGSVGGAIDTGYSGNPLTSVVTAPVNSPQPFVYLGDSARQRKVASDGSVTEIGLAPPLVAPTAALTEPQQSNLTNLVDDDMWGPYGAIAVPDTTPVPIVPRVDTLITQILYDDTAPGMASVALESFDNVTPGMWLTIGGEDRVIVQDILPVISPTTIDAILYDSGTTGLCTIQPTGSFSLSQIEAPDPNVVSHRYTDTASPVPPQVTVTRTIDYPVNAIVQLGGSEYVRILSVAVGKDGVQSFRCSTSGTFAATDTITGLASFRAWLVSTHAVSDAVTANAVQITAQALDTEEPVCAGVQMSVPNPDWSRVGSRATQPEDIIRVGVRINFMGFVQSVRLMLDVTSDEEVVTAFEQNYYFYEWRASDLIAAIQATGEAITNQVFQSQAGAVAQGRIDAAYVEQYGFGEAQSIQPVPIDPETANQNNFPYTQTPPTVPAAAPVSIGSGISRQMALGNDVWITLECRVGDLSRVGTDQSRSLQEISNVAIYSQWVGTEEEMELSFVDPYLVGGYGPDAGATLPPYVYRYRYRESATGVTSNPSPTMRAGVTPRRGRVAVTWDASPNTAVDLVDVFRFGGALARWTYVATFPNGDEAAFDDMADGQIDGGESLDVTRFQPWPTDDIPRRGTCRVVGTSVEQISGDTFNTNWSADSLIIINGRATQLAAQPSSTTRCEVVDNCGAGDPVEFTLPAPTILAQPLPAIWGGAINNAWFTFACGDPQDPSALHWTFGNDPDTTSDRNHLILTSPSEPLMNGFFDDGFAYVFTTERLLRIRPNFGGITDFLTEETACTKGLWNRWALAVSPADGVAFLAKDGIYLTRGGGDAQPITYPDLGILFPQEGTVPQSIRGYVPVDFSQPDQLRLAWVDRLLFFDFVDIDGGHWSFSYEPATQRWNVDQYPEAWDGVRVRLEEPGEGVYTHLFGTGDGFLNQVDANQITDGDEILPYAYWTSWDFGGDPRALKQWGDAVLDFNPGGSINGVTVTPTLVNGSLDLAPQVVGIDGVVRDTYLIECSDGVGVLSRNFGLKIEGFCELCDTQRPLFYLWEPSQIAKQVIVARRATDWEDLGYKGAKFVQGIVIRANTFGLDKCLAVEFDGPNNNPQQALVLTINHDGEQSKAYPLESATDPATRWNPFAAELVRLHGVDDEAWTLLDWRWVWEPMPEAATQWQTQETTFDFPGFLSVHDAVMAYDAPAEVALTVWHDLGSVTYTLPPTSGYQRIYTILQTAKGKAVRFRLTSTTPFRLYKRDCSVRVQPWGNGAYRILNPFGGPSREDGAGI